jgi:hypothetical protein
MPVVIDAACVTDYFTGAFSKLILEPAIHDLSVDCMNTSFSFDEE